MPDYTKEYVGNFVDLAFRGILRREPDEAGRAAYVRLLESRHDFVEALNYLISSKEFRRNFGKELKDGQGGYDFELDPVISRYRANLREGLTERLATAENISQEEIDGQLQAALRRNREFHRPLGGQEPYVEFHRVRFRELANIAGVLLSEFEKDWKPRILDFGYSMNTLALEALYPNALMHCADRSTIALMDRFGERAFSVDLVADNLENRDLGVRFDLIIFAEVIEHLLTNPVKVLRFFIKHLSDDGYLVLTTPNFFSFQKLQVLARRFNPQPVYPENYGPADAPHFHVREYSMGELLGATDQAGGKTVAFFFSGCWDPPELLAHIPEDQRSNLCVVAQRAVK
jgi:SAM-dependent methyltransferase